MKQRRVLLIGAAIVAALVVVALGVVCSSSFQTWLVRRELAARPELGLTVGRVSAGIGRVDVTDLQYQRGAVTLRAPSASIELPVLAALFNHRYDVRRLEARGWRLVTTPETGAAAREPTATGTSATLPGTVSATPMAPHFAGVFPMLDLPIELTVERLDLAGEVLLAGMSTPAKLSVAGGGLRPNHEAVFDVTADSPLDAAAVDSFHANGAVSVLMSTPRTFARITSRLEATATGGRLRQPITLQWTTSLARAAKGEAYALVLAASDRQLVSVDASFPDGAKQLSGRWKIDLKREDVSAFVPPTRLPAFEVQGEGLLESDPDLRTVHAVGRLDGTVDDLANWDAKLARVGPVKLSADVDVARKGTVVAVSKFKVDFAAKHPVGRIESLQPFEFNAGTREMRPSDPARDLLGIVIDALPVAWVQPFIDVVDVSGSDIRGELVATPRSDGFSFRTRKPVVFDKLSVTRKGKPLLRELDLSFTSSGDYAPQGWQAEVTGVTAKSGESTVLLLDTKAGRLAGEGKPIKATGLVSLDLRALADQPVAKDWLSVTRGEASLEFAGSFGATREVQGKIALRNLAVDPAVEADPLPAFSATLRADFGADGSVTLQAPLEIERDGRRSDLTIAGTIRPVSARRAFEIQLSSSQLVVDDAKLLALAFAGGDRTKRDGAPPPWAGLTGTLGLQLKKVVYSGAMNVTNVHGTLRLDGGAVQFEELRAAIGDSGNAAMNGTLSYAPDAAQPFALGAALSLTQFDPGPVFLALNPGQAPTIEGRFAITSKVGARAQSIGALPRAVTGDFVLTSRSGTFRGLPINVGNLVENSGKLSSWLASAGNAITSLAGRKEEDEQDITSRSRAASELAKILSAITYDQLSLVISRDASRSMEIRELTLISPEVRITGSGVARAATGRALFNEAARFEYQLRVRGRPAELMKFLGVLEGTPDDLGYFACNIPIRVNGTTARPDATEVSNRFVALAVEKTGLTEKAVDWINRLRGKTQQ